MKFRNEQIAEGIFWVGIHDDRAGRRCNPYLLVDGDEAVLFDPGSVQDFETVLHHIQALIPIGQIKYVVLHRQDPDSYASVPLFEKAGAVFRIVTHWRTKQLVGFFDAVSGYDPVDECHNSLKLKSGREVRFLQMPDGQCSSTFTSYDTRTKTLFSSDLFGAAAGDWTLYADDHYLEKMLAFHKHLLPQGNKIRPLLEMLLMMDIRTIAPQHGSVIREDTSKYLRALREFAYSTPACAGRASVKDDGAFLEICNLVLKRYGDQYSEEEIFEAVSSDTKIRVDKAFLAITESEYTGPQLWDALFQNVYTKLGIDSLLGMEPLVRRLLSEYDLPIPAIFQVAIKNVYQESLLLKSEVQQLRGIIEKLTDDVEQSRGNVTTCPVTGLYNETFFGEYLKTELNLQDPSAEPIRKCLAILAVDDMPKIKLRYGDGEADRIMRGIAYLLQNGKTENEILFRLRGAVFACLVSDTTKEDAVSLAERLRNTIRLSNQFVEPLTVSIGVVSLDELQDKENLPKKMLDAARTRLRIAKRQGGNIVCSESDIELLGQERKKVMLVDSDTANQDVLKMFLENLKFQVLIAGDGEAAVAFAEKERPDAIVSEVMLPKIDGFLLREKLQLKSTTRKIPFIFLSNLKDEDSVTRAVSLGVEHYLKKPYMIPELLGIIQLKVRGKDAEGE